jgi:hypothetical protein
VGRRGHHVESRRVERDRLGRLHHAGPVRHEAKPGGARPPKGIDDLDRLESGAERVDGSFSTVSKGHHVGANTGSAQADS